MYKIECPFKIIASHCIEESGFIGSNYIELRVPHTISNPFGLTNTEVNINKTYEDSYKFSIISSSLCTKEDQINFIDCLAKFFSFYINATEPNPHYGTFFIKIDWFHLNITNTTKNFQNTISLRDGLSITTKRIFDLSVVPWSINLNNDILNDLLHFYYSGSKEEHEKSKYFHWFLILEYLEHTNKYKKMFSDPLFEGIEKIKIEKLADFMKDDRKKSIIKGLLRYTKKKRSEKLLEFLKYLGIIKYKSFDKILKLNEQIVKELIDERNRIFHIGESVSKSLLWGHLFPIVTKILEIVSLNPELLL
ncbi:hypothetical protein [Thermosulfurimonas sp. F29]|uniref:hypothetical protein n=1 Tax=Thermosulfurimonas sp. F29 TaxID=2867247 RepID=UPI001C83D75C|nr:hypothetical protein [Thermosulfurimonas sp. F29]MBX6422002.1 hypothetical protein [Thermosulfurimonas sp. F29]